MKLALFINLIRGIGAYSLISQKLISLGVLLVTLALLLAATISFIGSSWFSFVLFLIYVTGLLVLFRYLISLRPNIHHTAKKCFKAYYLILIPFIFYRIFRFLPKRSLNYEKVVVNLIRKSRLIIFILITLTLLFILLIVVTLAYKAANPLRKHL